MVRIRRQRIKHTFAPDRGLAQNLPSTLINERQTPECSNVKFRFGEVSKSPGYVKFGSESLPLSNDGSAGSRVMALPDFTTLAGTKSYLALTLKDAFIYNTGTFRWRAMGRTAEDCEGAWTTAANVTDSNDTSDYKVGSASLKLVATSSYTKNAMFAYKDIAHSDQNYSAYDRVHFWIKSTLAQDAGDLIIRFAQDDALGGTTASVNVPALSAATWYYLSLDLDLSSITSCDSVGLVTSTGFDDTTTQTIWIDDIRASTKWTGSPGTDDQWTWASQAGAGASQETAPTWFKMLANGKSGIFKWDGTAVEFTTITGTLGAGTLTQCKVLASYKDTLHAMNTSENSINAPQRDRFGDTAEEDDWTTGVSGYIDCYDTPGEILASTILGPYLVVYKEDGIILLEHNSAATPIYDKTARITGSQFFATKAIGSANNIDYFLARDNIYAFSGLHEAIKIGDPIRDMLLEDLDYGAKDECFAFIQQGKHRITFVIPKKADSTYTHFYTYDYAEKAWTKGTFGHYMTCAGLFEGGDQTLTWDDAIGNWEDQVGTWADRPQETQDKTILLGDNGGYVYQMSDTGKSYAGTAIDANWQTKDFALPPDHQRRAMRYGKVAFGARGDLVSVSYSTDEGATWTALLTDQALTPTTTDYAMDMNFSAKKTRFKFHDANNEKDFYISWIGVEYVFTTTRT